MFPTNGAKKMQRTGGSVFHTLKDSRLLTIANFKSWRLISVLLGICLLSAKCRQVFL